jgi:hypothetical protein
MIVHYYAFAFLQCDIKFLCIPATTLGEFFLVILSTDIASQITLHFDLKK